MSHCLVGVRRLCLATSVVFLVACGANQREDTSGDDDASVTSSGGTSGGQGGSTGKGGSGTGGASGGSGGGSGGASSGGAGGGSGGSGSGGAGGSGGASNGGAGGSGGTSGGKDAGVDAIVANKDSGATQKDSGSGVAPTFTSLYNTIFKSGCGSDANCHVGANAKEHMDFSTQAKAWTTIVKTSDHSNMIVVGKPDSSFFIPPLEHLATVKPEKQMPMGLPMLPPDQIKAIRDWITAGAKND